MPRLTDEQMNALKKMASCDVPVSKAVAALLARVDELEAACRWESNRQRDALKWCDDKFGSTLVDRFGTFGSDAIEHLAESFVEREIEIERLRRRVGELEGAITRTLTENRHLADGDDCTLIELKRVRAGTFLQRLEAAHKQGGVDLTGGLTIEEAIDEVR